MKSWFAITAITMTACQADPGPEVYVHSAAVTVGGQSEEVGSYDHRNGELRLDDGWGGLLGDEDRVYLEQEPVDLPLFPGIETVIDGLDLEVGGTLALSSDRSIDAALEIRAGAELDALEDAAQCTSWCGDTSYRYYRDGCIYEVFQRRYCDYNINPWEGACVTYEHSEWQVE